MTPVEAIVLAVSISLLAWIAFSLGFLRDRLSKPRALSPFALFVGPVVYATVLLALMQQGVAMDAAWATAAALLGATVAAQRSRGTRLWLDGAAGKIMVATSPLALVSIAAIALVQPLVLAARLTIGRNFGEASVHIHTAVFLLGISATYAVLILVRIYLSVTRRRASDAIAGAPQESEDRAV